MIPVNEMGQSSIKNIARTYSKHFGTKNMLFFECSEEVESKLETCCCAVILL